MRKFSFKTVALIIILGCVIVGGVIYKNKSKFHTDLLIAKNTKAVDKLNKTLNKNKLPDVTKIEPIKPIKNDNKTDLKINNEKLPDNTTKLEPENIQKINSNKTNKVSNTFESTEKEFNEEIVGEMLKSRAIEASNLRQQNEIEALSTGLKKGLYESLSGLLKEDETLKKLMVLGFMKKELDLDLDPKVYMALGQKNQEEQKKEEDTRKKLEENFNKKMGELDKFKSDIIDILNNQSKLNDKNSIDARVKLATDDSDKKIIDALNMYVKDYLSNKIKIDGIYETGKNIKVYATIDNRYLELKKGMMLEKSNEYISINIQDINKSLIKYYVSINYKNNLSSFIYSVPFRVAYADEVPQPQIPNYYLGDKKLAGSGFNKTTTKPAPVNKNEDLNNIKNILEQSEKQQKEIKQENRNKLILPQNRPGYTPQYYMPQGAKKPIMGTSETMQPQEN